MVVQFDNKAVRQTVEHKTEPIGVEGDPSSMKKGGVSEADAIVSEARRSMGEIPTDGQISEEEKGKISQDIIREEDEKESGPELKPEGASHLAAAEPNK